MNKLSRRSFMKASALASGALASTSTWSMAMTSEAPRRIRIADVNSNFEREPLVRPFGFKGGSISNIWQVACLLSSEGGKKGLGIGTQNVLWSDAKVFSSNSEAAGNALMYAVTEKAMQLAKGQEFVTPIDLQESLLDEVYEYAKQVTSRADLRKTFALNAMVGVDNAAWMLYAEENGFTQFDELVPAAYGPSLSQKHDRVASIPVVAYNMPVPEIAQLVDGGFFLLKIKIGQPGTQREMLAKDKERLTALHQALGQKTTPHTEDGKLPYYFDANGRYEKKETLLEFVDHAKKIGAFDQIAVVEEPFAEHREMDVSDIEVRLAADESAHTDADAIARIEMGYKAIALKAVAKTMSMTMKIAQVAHERGIPCFCADLTVNPVLLEWNKYVAARLSPFPGMKDMGLMETNGHQNYLHWQKMRSYLPDESAGWTKAVDGVFPLSDAYYAHSGHMLTASNHYMQLVK